MTKQKKLPALSESEFLKQVIQLAHLYKWRCAHFRGVRVQRKDGSIYYQTPVQGDGVGFPDCVLARDNETTGARLIFAELKSEKGKPSEAQKKWLELLGDVQGVEVYLWKPSDFQNIVDILK